MLSQYVAGARTSQSWTDVLGQITTDATAEGLELYVVVAKMPPEVLAAALWHVPFQGHGDPANRIRPRRHKPYSEVENGSNVSHPERLLPLPICGSEG